jgi:hypothetical protein
MEARRGKGHKNEEVDEQCINLLHSDSCAMLNKTLDEVTAHRIQVIFFHLTLVWFF